MKRILLRLGLVVVLCAVVAWCVLTGKAYDIIVENLPVQANGQQVASFEAVQVTLDGKGEPIYLLDGDRMVASAVGLTHTIKIELLDEKDEVTETRNYSFSILDLNEKMELNIPQVYQQAK